MNREQAILSILKLQDTIALYGTSGVWSIFWLPNFIDCWSGMLSPNKDDNASLSRFWRGVRLKTKNTVDEHWFNPFIIWQRFGHCIWVSQGAKFESGQMVLKKVKWTYFQIQIQIIWSIRKSDIIQDGNPHQLTWSWILPSKCVCWDSRDIRDY